PQSQWNNGLERPSDRESQSLTLAGQEDAGQLGPKAKLCVRVVKINEPERHVDDRHLNAELYADARLPIRELRKCGIVDLQERILLNLATQPELLDLRRKARRTAEPVAAAELIQIVGLCKNAAAIEEKAAETALKDRCIDKSESGKAARTEKLLIRQELAIDRLRAGLVQIEYRTDIAKDGHRSRSKARK